MSATRITVRVRPAARQSGVVGFDGGVVRVDVAAPAVQNRANEELIKVLAGELQIARSQVRILRGFTGREKVLDIDLPPERVNDWLARLPTTRSPTGRNR